MRKAVRRESNRLIGAAVGAIELPVVTDHEGSGIVRRYATSRLNSSIARTVQTKLEGNLSFGLAANPVGSVVVELTFGEVMTAGIIKIF